MDTKENLFQDFRGAVSIRKCGEIVFQRAYGYADLANKVRNQLDTKFATAFAGKVFVAVAILQLIDQGRLKFDSQIGDFLDFDLNRIDRIITIQQLLTHTSGIPDYFNESVTGEYAALWRDYPNYRIRSPKDLLPLFIEKPMMYKPGERFLYNNTGYAVLAMVIETVTDMPFDRHMKNAVFEPSGMENTGYYEMDRLPEKCANSYILDSDTNEYYTNIYSVDAKGTGAGGVFTTVLDIDRFWDALLADKLMSSQMRMSMMRTQSTDGDSYYGYGLWLDKVGINKYFPHFEGCDLGISFISSYNLEQRISKTLVSNFGDNVWEISEKLEPI